MDMQVNVISETKQEFNGEVYYLCGCYFQRKGKRLHRAVWEYHNGNIPDGYEIHHIDGDRSHNSLENLYMMPAEEHHRHHMTLPARVEQSRRDIRQAAQHAARWHGSEVGEKWHGDHARQYWAKAPMREYVCTFCGRCFRTRHLYGETQNRFCHQNCRAGYRRRRIKEEGCEG